LANEIAKTLSHVGGDIFLCNVLHLGDIEALKEWLSSHSFRKELIPTALEIYVLACPASDISIWLAVRRPLTVVSVTYGIVLKISGS